MSQFSLMAATRHLEKSMPFVLYRFALTFGIGFGYLFVSLCGAGIAIAFDYLGKNPNAFAPYGAVAGFAIFGVVMYKTRPWWLHLVTIRQLALLAEQAQGQQLPHGKAQLDHAKQRVNHSFPSTSGLFALDQQLQTALAELPEAPALSHPQAAKAGQWLLGQLSALNHQTILALHFYSDATNPWQTAAQGVAIQHRHLAALLKYRLYAFGFAWLGFIAAFPLLTRGLEMLTSDFPFQLGIWAYIFGGVFSWTLKAAFFEPIGEAAMMQALFPLAASVTADDAQALAQHSASVKAILEKAA